MTLEDINSVEQELIRFQKRLIEAKERMERKDFHYTSGTKETGALKRAAIDLKNELTKLNK